MYRKLAKIPLVLLEKCAEIVYMFKLDIITKTNNTLKTYFSAGIAMTNTSLSSLE